MCAGIQYHRDEMDMAASDFDNLRAYISCWRLADTSISKFNAV